MFQVPRSQRRWMYEELLERTNPIRKLLIRAQPYTCPRCFPDPATGQRSVTLTCTVCNGTGYEGAPAGADITKEPYSRFYFCFADLQIGHGLYGQGGNLYRLLSDLGKLQIGDATLFAKVSETDRRTGEIFHVMVDESLPRPDIIVEPNTGDHYNVLKEMRANIGDDDVGRIFLCEKGQYGQSR